MELRLAVDTHHLLLEDAGTRRVTVNLLKQFSALPEIRLVQFQPNYLLPKGKGSFQKLGSYILRLFWVHVHLPVKCFLQDVDILLSPEYNTPLYTHCKRAVIAHDAHIRAQREFISPLWFYCYYIPFIEYPIRRADLIFTVSQYAKTQIVELMRLAEHKVHVAYNGIDPRFMRDQPNSELNTLPGLTAQEYILFVGTFEARKNIERLIGAFALFKKTTPGDSSGIKLAIAGKPSTGKHSDRNKKIMDLINELNLQSEIIVCGYVSDDDLPKLYANSLMIAFPSLYEGFGLPVIEGFASGVPVLTSDLSSMPEIAGDAAMLVDPYDVNEMAEKLRLLIFDKDLRERLIEAGKQRVKKFTWELCAQEMMLNIKSLFTRK